MGRNHITLLLKIWFSRAREGKNRCKYRYRKRERLSLFQYIHTDRTKVKSRNHWCVPRIYHWWLRKKAVKPTSQSPSINPTHTHTPTPAFFFFPALTMLPLKKEQPSSFLVQGKWGRECCISWRLQFILSKELIYHRTKALKILFTGYSIKVAVLRNAKQHFQLL